MTLNEKQELLTLVKDNNRILKNIWTFLQSSNDDLKDFIMNVIANQIGERI